MPLSDYFKGGSMRTLDEDSVRRSEDSEGIRHKQVPGSVSGEEMGRIFTLSEKMSSAVRSLETDLQRLSIAVTSPYIVDPLVKDSEKEPDAPSATTTGTQDYPLQSAMLSERRFHNCEPASAQLRQCLDDIARHAAHTGEVKGDASHSSGRLPSFFYADLSKCSVTLAEFKMCADKVLLDGCIRYGKRMDELGKAVKEKIDREITQK